MTGGPPPSTGAIISADKPRENPTPVVQQVVQTNMQNPPHPRYRTEGCADTEDRGGDVHCGGYEAARSDIGIRPALWIQRHTPSSGR